MVEHEADSPLRAICWRLWLATMLGRMLSGKYHLLRAVQSKQLDIPYTHWSCNTHKSQRDVGLEQGM